MTESSQVQLQPRLIKRYANRKLYDTRASSYLTLPQIADFVRQGVCVKVIDNRTGVDITSHTLIQIVFENEKLAGLFAPVMTLKEIICHRDGSLSPYLAKLGAFAECDLQTRPVVANQVIKANQEFSELPEVRGTDQKITEILESLAGRKDASGTFENETIDLPVSNLKLGEVGP